MAASHRRIANLEVQQLGRHVALLQFGEAIGNRPSVALQCVGLRPKRLFAFGNERTDGLRNNQPN
ncbi:MAG: hypothetical protein ABSA49_19220, partial [Rhizomicrobium sp.]